MSINLLQPEESSRLGKALEVVRELSQRKSVRIAGLIILGLAVVSLLAGALYRGFHTVVSGNPSTAVESERIQLLWDWVNLLLVLLVLALSALWFNWMMRKREHEGENPRALTEQQIASDRLQETALEAYLDRMTKLLLDKELLASKPTDAVLVIARAYTLAVLRKLDGTRKGTLLRFLHDLGLLGREVTLELGGADLSHADLAGAILTETNLSGLDLRQASLWRADLTRGKLSGTNLSRADLRGANMDWPVPIWVVVRFTLPT
jgi:hypothetical protein